MNDTTKRIESLKSVIKHGEDIVEQQHKLIAKVLNTNSMLQKELDELIKS